MQENRLKWLKISGNGDGFWWWKYWILTAEKMLADHTPLCIIRFCAICSLIDINVIKHLPVQLPWLISGNKEIILAWIQFLSTLLDFQPFCCGLQCFFFHFFIEYQSAQDMSDSILFQGCPVGSSNCVSCFNCNWSKCLYFSVYIFLNFCNRFLMVHDSTQWFRQILSSLLFCKKTSFLHICLRQDSTKSISDR